MSGDRDDSPRFRHEYTEDQVARLLGLHESWGRDGRRHVTLIDLLSWLRDPGGDAVWYHLASHEDPMHAWMAKRGPIPPDGELATAVWDLMAAIAKLPLKHIAVVALTAFGFSEREIGQSLNLGKTQVRRILEGDDKRGVTSVVSTLTTAMNGSHDT